MGQIVLVQNVSVKAKKKKINIPVWKRETWKSPIWIKKCISKDWKKLLGKNIQLRNNFRKKISDIDKETIDNK